MDEMRLVWKEVDSMYDEDWDGVSDASESRMTAGGSSSSDGVRISSADTDTSNLKLSNIVLRLAAVAGRPMLAESSSISSIPWAML